MTLSCPSSSGCHQGSSCSKAGSPLGNAVRTIALVGNPNCGKTTLFNVLTGARQRVGNWPGVTVERKSGFFLESGKVVEVIDLPGTYALSLSAQTSAIDECIACEYILDSQADVIVNIVDASNLERHLYLTMQLLEMGVPMVLALNMMDVARAHRIQIDIAGLSKLLGCPVIALEANKSAGIRELKAAVLQPVANSNIALGYPTAVRTAMDALAKVIQESAINPVSHDAEMPATTKPLLKPSDAWLSMRLLEGDAFVGQRFPAVMDYVTMHQAAIQQVTGEDADILLADTRYQFISQLCQQFVSRAEKMKSTWTERIDAIVLNRVLGIPIFLIMMYLLFFFSINIGGAFQDFFDISSNTIFVDGVAFWLSQHHAPVWLIAILANGVGKGINTTVTFIPVIGAMFLFLALLEDSGYMARAAFVIDRFMRVLGLPGKAFVPMIVGFGCNVPAVMGARTLDNKRDRIITIMMSPFMSCGARLAIYAVFTAAFFPQGGQNIVFALYLIGIFMAVMTGLLLRHTALKGDASPLVMELPVYHIPRMRTLGLHAWQRLKGFLFRAGKLIVPICVILGALNALNIDGTINMGDADTRSLLSLVGQAVTPIFSPMGLHIDNWPATVGLVTGILAKEVVVGTLNTLYSQMGHLAAIGSGGFHFWTQLSDAVWSIPQNLSQLSQAFSNPVLAQAPIDPVNQGVYGLMYQKFDGKIGAFAYMLFILLYFPCVSTMAAMLRELHKGWSIFSAVWMTGVAYGVAVFFYQAATWSRHPWSSALWLGGITLTFSATVILMRWYTQEDTHSRMEQIGEGI